MSAQFDPAAWVAAYKEIGGSLAVQQVDGALFLASSQPRKTAGYKLDEELTAEPAKLAAVCEHLAEVGGGPQPAGAVPFRAADWVRAYRAAGGKAQAYVYAGDETDPRDPFPVLQLTHLPRSDAATLAEALTPQQRDHIAEHVAQIDGATLAFGRRD